jgi:hypothetical protein
VAKIFDFAILPLLAPLRNLSVEMPDNEAMKYISGAAQLTSLRASGGFKLASLEPLSGLVNLTQLKLWSGSLTSTRGLAAFDRLETLNLGCSKVQETTELGNLKNLKKMELVGNKRFQTLIFHSQATSSCSECLRFQGCRASDRFYVCPN